MVEGIALFVMYLSGAAVGYGVWRGRRSAMVSGGGRWTLRGWHIAMWLAVSVWITAVVVASAEGLRLGALRVLIVVPVAGFVALGRRLHRQQGRQVDGDQD
jgi:hypothetical protein